ncbi:membrane protein [Leisingera sp. ANG-M7]|nr:membrane protein [Leisingera sp. ANG-M7]
MAMSETTSIQPSRNVRLKGIGIALIGAALMSLDPVFIRFSGVEELETSFLFGLFTAISMAVVIQLKDKRGVLKVLRESGWPLLAAGILMLGSASGLVFAIKNTSVANTFLIFSTTPAIAAVFSWIFLREKVSGQTLFAIVGVFAGIAVVVSGSTGTSNWFGDMLAVFAVSCLALMMTLLRKFPDVSRMGAVGVGGFLLALTMFFFTEPSAFSLNTWLIMGAMGLLTAPFGRVLSMVATRYATATEVSMTLMLETVLAPIWAFIFFTEVPGANSLVGGAIILVTIVAYTLHLTREEG